VLQVRHLSKSFGAVQVLKSVSLDLAAGEIHGLIGANGCGKTTLLNILFGHPLIAATGGYSGDLLLEGRATRVDSPVTALRCGIGMIHQEFALIPSMTVAENIKINRERTQPLTDRLFGRTLSLVHRRGNRDDAERALATLGVSLPADMRVSQIALSTKQFVEIAREIDKRRLQLLMLDEPSAVLSQSDTERLMEALRKLSAEGTAILYVSHRLEEVISLCDRITVLREGKVVGQWARPGFDLRTMVEQMSGRQVVKARRTSKKRAEEVLCRIEDLHVDKPGERLQGLSLDVKQGEILGLAGLSGHGKLAIGPGIMGMHPIAGRIYLNGEQIRNPGASIMLHKGVCFLPEDRTAAGLLMDHAIMDNIVFTAAQVDGRFARTRWLKALSLLNRAEIQRYAQDCVDRFHIKCRSIRQRAAELSGGNQQKVCIARALAIQPKLLIVSEPTRGVDVVAKEIILEIFLELNRDLGMTLVIASSELDELKRICDRIAVIYKGRLFDILAPDCEDRDFTLAFSGEWKRKP